MCGSEELIHDARQVDLEDVIMTTEMPGSVSGQEPIGVFVRLPLSEDQAHTFLKESSHAWDECNGSSDGLACTSGLLAIGTPIQPCTDVETIGWLDPTLLDALRVNLDTLLGVTLANIETPTRNIPLVRRTDMEAQVVCAYEKGWAAGKCDACNQQSRVVAEKDAEIARLNEELSVYRAGMSELLAKEVADLLKGGAA